MPPLSIHVSPSPPALPLVRRAFPGYSGAILSTARGSFQLPEDPVHRQKILSTARGSSQPPEDRAAPPMPSHLEWVGLRSSAAAPAASRAQPLQASAKKTSLGSPHAPPAQLPSSHVMQIAAQSRLELLLRVAARRHFGPHAAPPGPAGCLSSPCLACFLAAWQYGLSSKPQ